MKKKFITKLVALTLALTLAISIVPMATVSTSATISLTSFDGWVTNQLYTRGLSQAGSVLETIGEATGHEGFANFTSFINNTFCGGSDTGEKLAELQATCNEILDTTKKVTAITNDINSKISSEIIAVSSKDCDNAWESQVMGYITKNDGSPYDFYNVYLAYRDYLDYAANESTGEDDSTLKVCENKYINEIIKYYKGKTNSTINSKHEMYTTDTIDVCITGMLSSILNTMDPNITSGGIGNRFIDLSAQYAYYAYPYSDTQAEFIDYATQYQVNTVTYLLMIYQDFLAHRAEYLESSKNAENAEIYNDLWESCYKEYYESILVKFTTSIENFLNGDIYLKNIKAHTTLDSYVRAECVSVSYDNEKESFALTNNNFKSSHRDKYVKCTTEYYYKSDITSNSTFTKTVMEFYKSAAVTVKDNKLVFTPFYVLNSSSLDNCYNFLKYFDLNDEDVHGEIQLTAYYDTHYLNADYYNLKDGKFTDGTNTYVPVSDVNQLKSLINETYYTANKCTPYSYFAPFINHGYNNPVYLLLNGNPTISRPENTTHYTKFPVFNMSSQREYATEWTKETMNLYNLQSDRKNSENKTNSMYTLILVPQDSVTKSKVSTQLYGDGEITVSDKTETTAETGKKVNVKITAPENHVISKITATYHNGNNQVDKVISTGMDANEFTFEYPVPYSDVTITVITEEVGPALNMDKYGNYLVTNADDLHQMADMVNSGYSKYVNGNYILTNDINAVSTGKLWTTPIGTEECPFSGAFDGQGYSITNFKIDPVSTENNIGLFGTVVDGSIENLNLVMATDSASEYHYSLGTVCGYIKDGSISNCTVSGNFVVSSELTGGIVGTADNSIIKNCKTKLDITSFGYGFVEDICCDNINSEIVDCVSDNNWHVFLF